MALGCALGLGLVARDAAALCVAAVALMALGDALGLGLVARDAAALCVAGAVQTDICCRFAWQAWQAWQAWHLPSFCVAGAALMALGGALGLGLIARDAAAFYVAGVAQTHI